MEIERTKEEERVIAYWQDERYRRQLPNAMFHASDDNPLCGDEMTFDVSINNGIVTEVGFSGEACTITTAMAAMLCEAMINKPATDYKDIDPFKLIGLAVCSNRKQCILLPWRVFKKCISSSGLIMS